MREKHVFQFKASDIAAACKTEAEYHRKRQAYWSNERENSIAIVKKTAKLSFREYEVTGGVRFEAFVDYGDQGAYKRLSEAWDKFYSHKQAAERFETDFRVYKTQGDRMYELDTSDVHYYRLGGQPREEEEGETQGRSRPV